MSLKFGPLSTATVHLCVDMQRMFAERTQWCAPWMERVLPAVVHLVAHNPERTVFSRFITARQPGAGHGTWARYYERWAGMTQERLEPGMLDLVAPLQAFVPPATVIDKHVYAPWLETDLHARLQEKHIDTLVLTGSETEMCVLATALGAIDLGYRVVIASDAVCSSADSTHDAMMGIYDSRFGMQVEIATVAEICAAWPRD